MTTWWEEKTNQNSAGEKYIAVFECPTITLAGEHINSNFVYDYINNYHISCDRFHILCEW